MNILIDASAIIYGWDNHPIELPIFDKLWEWLSEEQIANNTIGMVKENFEEVEKVSPDCHQWLKDKGIAVINVNNQVLQKAYNVSLTILEVRDDKYSSSGCDFNDLLLIAAASINSMTVVTQEAVQTPTSKTKKQNYKIPLVCSLLEQPIQSLSFLDYLKHQNH